MNIDAIDIGIVSARDALVDTLWVDDIHALVTRWLRHGGAIVTPPTEIRPGVRTALLADPDGNAIEAMQQD